MALIRASSARNPLTRRTAEARRFEVAASRGSCPGFGDLSLAAPFPALAASAAGRVLGTRGSREIPFAVPPPAAESSNLGIGHSACQLHRVEHRVVTGQLELSLREERDTRGRRRLYVAVERA